MLGRELPQRNELLKPPCITAAVDASPSTSSPPHQIMIARQVFYSGRVQGVGFRVTVKGIARGFEVVGWVKNLPDGRVEMLATAADSDELMAFLEAIDDSDLASFIKERQIHITQPPTDLRGFTIA
jgi:acylphosphatase